MNYIDLIKKYIKSNFERFPPKEGEPPLDPNIYYQNGNDGTDFDWRCNGRTCEFFIFYNSERQLGYMKVYATKDGNLEGYVWDTERYSEGVSLPPCPIGYQVAVGRKRWLETTYDKNNIWDHYIDYLELIGGKA